MKAVLATAAVGAFVSALLWLSVAALKVEVAECNAKIVACEANVQKQNDAIQALQAAAALGNSQAAGRVTTVFLKAEEQKRTLPQGTGPAVMNEFMRAVFK